MASEIILKQKQELVENLTNKLQNAVAGVVVDYKGINVEDDTKLRRELREAGIEYFVVKNTMLRRAAANVGLSALDSVLEGSTALAISTEDHTAAARILTKYAETSKTFSVKAGFLDGEVIDAAKVEELGKIPSKDVMVAITLGTLLAPISGLARVLNAIAEKQGAEA
ncbi:MAG: 50S ribosomal protein L10 [Ruminococcaceae bacterium]|nr:50S ribosomal protein L10 [Oscillospiraceae bacterium]